MDAGHELGFLVDHFIDERSLRFKGEARMTALGAPGSGSVGHVKGLIKNHFLYAGIFRALLDNAGVDFFEETRDRSDDCWTDFEESLGDGVDRFDVGESGTLEDIDVIEGAAVDVGEWKEGECDVFGGIEAEIVADVVDVGAKIAVR